MVDVVGLRYVDQGREQVIAGTKQYTTAVDQAAQATTRAAATTTRATRATSVQTDVVRANAQAHQFASRSMNATGMALQQTGYQVGDFLVQVQSGTNWMVAFGQQATQLVGVLPMFGSVLGVSGTALVGLTAGLGIAIPLVTAIGAAFMRTSGEANTFEQAIGDLETAVSDYADAMDLARGSSEAVREEFGFTSDLLEKLVRDFKVLAEIKALDSIGVAVARLRSEHISGFESDIENIKDLLGETGWFAAAGEAVAQFDAALLRLENRSLSLDERLASALDLRDQLLEVSGGIYGMTSAQRSFYDALLQTIQQMETFRGIQSDAREEARLNQAMNEETARQQAALLEENARFEQEQIDKRVAAEAAANERRIAAIELYYDNVEKAEAERARVEAARAAIRKQRAEEEAALQKAMAQQVAAQQAALLEENARFEQEQIDKRVAAEAAANERRIAAIELYYDNVEKAEAERARVEAARAAIRKQRAEEEAALQKATAQQVADQQAALLEENARYERATREQVDNFNAQNRSLQDQLNLTQTIAQFGQDSAEVRALQLEQEIAVRQRSIDAQVAENRLTEDQGNLLKVLVAELLRAEAAASATADEVSGIAPGLQAALDQANAFADAMGRARAESAGIGISTAGLQAQAAALEGGASRAEATATAAATTLRERLTSELSGPVGRGTGTRIEQQVAERYDAVLQRELAQERVRTLTAATGGGTSGSSAGAAATQDDYLQNLLLEAEQKRKLVGLSEEETRRQEILFELKKRDLLVNDALSEQQALMIEQIVQEEAQKRRLMELEQQRQQLMDTIEGHIQSAFMTMVDGSASVEDAFRNMLRNILLAIYEQQVAKPAAEGIGSLLSKGLGSLFGPGMTTGTPLQIPSSGVGSLLPTQANGGGWNNGVQFFANGGVVNSPTMFGHSGGLGVMGEAGPEAIMPLKRGANGKLGVQVDGNAGNVTVNQYFNIAANGDDSVRRIVRQESPRIAEQAKAAVLDAKRRGGSYGRSF